jgi:hypothetical protein
MVAMNFVSLLTRGGPFKYIVEGRFDAHLFASKHVGELTCGMPMLMS